MEFRKYQHIERFGTSEVRNIENGTCYVFPKIDGTNSSVWMHEGELCAGSRKHQLSLENDNAGFYRFIREDERIRAYLQKYPTHRLFGEWLVPHSLKTYRDNAWRHFYIFDVCVDADNEVGLEYLPYEVYQPLLEEFGLDYIAPLKIIENGSLDDFAQCLEQNDFLIKEGNGCGEGIVIKNYAFYNRFKRQTWAKIVAAEFHEKKHRGKGVPAVTDEAIEEAIVNRYVTEAFVEKEYAKIVTGSNGWTPQMIPQLFSRIYHELVCEEMWNILKVFKNPTINFNVLNTLTIQRIKQIKPEIFKES